MTGFLDTETALAIKPTSKIKGQNVDTKYWLNAVSKYILIKTYHCKKLKIFEDMNEVVNCSLL